MLGSVPYVSGAWHLRAMQRMENSEAAHSALLRGPAFRPACFWNLSNAIRRSCSRRVLSGRQMVARPRRLANGSRCETACKRPVPAGLASTLHLLLRALPWRASVYCDEVQRRSPGSARCYVQTGLDGTNAGKRSFSSAAPMLDPLPVQFSRGRNASLQKAPTPWHEHRLDASESDSGRGAAPGCVVETRDAGNFHMLS